MPLSFAVRGPVALPGGSIPTGTKLDAATKSTFLTLSNFDLTVASSGGGGGSNVLSTQSFAGGGSTKWYLEATIQGNGGLGLGLAGAGWTTDGAAIGFDGVDLSIALYNDGHVYKTNGSYDVVAFAAVTTGDVVGMAHDASVDKVWFSRNGVWDGDPVAGTGGHGWPAGMASVQNFAAVELETNGNQATVNFNGSGTAFVYGPPSGYIAWP